VDAISPINSGSSNTENQSALLSAAGAPVAAAFEDLIDQWALQRTSKNPGPSQAEILAQQRNEEFLQKLALLTGMMEQAQIAMDSQPPLPGGLPNPSAGAYYFFRAELGQVGLPGAVPDVV